jgi:hypothetical protein
MSRSRFIFIVFYMTAVLISVVLMRNNSSRIFNKFRESYVKQNDLTQDLWRREIFMEKLTTPAEISRRMKKAQTESDDR